MGVLSGMRRKNREKIIEANLLAGATVSQIAASLDEPVDVTTATIFEMTEKWRKDWAALSDTQTEINLRRVDLAINALWGTKGVQAGDTDAIKQVLKLVEMRNNLLERIRTEPFPASEDTPGQTESRTAYAEFRRLGDRLLWWNDYLMIRNRLVEQKAAGEIERSDWRLAAYIAWASSPVLGRWPETEKELANQVLGLKSSRSIRKWKVKYEWIGKEVAYWQAAPLMRHRRDAFETLTHGVQQKHDPRYFQYLKLFMEMTGDHIPKQKTIEDSPIAIILDE